MTGQRSGSNGRPGDSSTKALLSAWYGEFLTDTLRNYPRADELPTTFNDFDYVWSTFQTSNRKLRSSVVELTDFERETVLEYLRDQLRVLEFDAAGESITWNPDEIEKASGDKPAAQRRPWSQATNDWGAPVQTPKNHSQVEELFWGSAPAQGPIDPAWQFFDTPSPQIQSSQPKAAPMGSWAQKATSNGKPAKNGSSGPAPKIDDSKKRPQVEQRPRPESRSSGPIEPPPKRPVQQSASKRPVKQPGNQNDWAAVAKRDSRKEIRPETQARDSRKEIRLETQAAQKPAIAKKDTRKEARVEPKAIEKNRSAAVVDHASKKREKKEDVVVRKSESEKKTSKANAPKTNPEEAPTWKAEGDEKKGSGMALLGFDYL